MRFCPQCGKEAKDPDSKFCIGCGNMFRDTSVQNSAERTHEYRGSQKTSRKNKGGTSTVTAIIVALIILVAVGGGAIAAIGGKVSFAIDYEEDYFVFINESVGVFDEFEWTVADEDGSPVHSVRTVSKDTVQWKASDHGVYTVTLVGYSLLRMQRAASQDFIENGVREYTTEWNMDGKHSVNVEVTVSDYFDYKNYNFSTRSNSDARWPGSSADQALMNEFMQTGKQNDTMDDITAQLKDGMPSGLSRDQQVNYIMGFVQNLDPDEDTYKGDPILNGIQTDYWNFPIETLFKKGGDCEDLAMLLMALCILFFDDQDLELSVGLALFFPPEVPNDFGHAMAIIHMNGLAPTSGDANFQVTGPVFSDGTPSEYYIGVAPNGKQYYACETTGRGFTVGMFGIAYNEDRTAEVHYVSVNPSKVIIV